MIKAFSYLLVYGFLLLPSIHNVLGADLSGTDGYRPQPTTPAQTPTPAPQQNDYLHICGQACAYTTAAEIDSVTMIYLHDHPAFNQVKEDPEQKKIIADCIQYPEQAKCNEPANRRLILNAMLRYRFGKEVRDSFLTNKSNEKNIKSVTIDDPSRKYENTYERHSVAWLQKKGLKITDFDKRDVFKLRQQDIKDATAIADKANLLGPKFMEEYGVFLNSYTEPHKRHYAISMINKSKDPNQDSVKTFVDHTEVPLKPGEATNNDKDSYPTTYNQVQYDKAEQDYLRLQKIVEKEKQEILKNSKPVVTKEKDGHKLSGVDIVDVGLKYSDASGNLTERPDVYVIEKNKNKNSDDKNRSTASASNKDDKKQDQPKEIEHITPEKWAENMNKQIDAAVKSIEKKYDGKKNTTVRASYTYDPDDFNKFIDEIWPSSAPISAGSKQ